MTKPDNQKHSAPTADEGLNDILAAFYTWARSSPGGRNDTETVAALDAHYRDKYLKMLPSKPSFQYGSTSNSGGIYRTEEDAVLHGYCQAIDTITQAFKEGRNENG